MAHADEEASDRTPAPPPGHRPDWLVGAEEGLEAELEGRERQLPTPQLRRPGAPPGEVVQPKAPAAAPLERPPAPPQPPRSRLPELDDLDLTGLGLGGGDDRGMPPPPAPARETPSAAEPEPSAPSAYAAVASPIEPEVVLQRSVAERLRKVAQRSWKWAAAAAALVLLVSTLAQAIGVGTTSLSGILKAPGRYDGQRVKVRGRVSQDVYPVGGGYSFYLLQGRDSMVVFTRSRVPHARETLELEAQVSTGMLGASERPALLEQVK